MDDRQFVNDSPSSKGWELLLWFLVVFAGLVLWRQEVLTLPPYEDQALGYWSEADFLKQHHFDYYRFLFLEPNFVDETPGRRAYAISILAPMLAVLQILIPDTTTLLVTCHLLFFATAALMATMLCRALIPKTGRLGGYLASLILVTSPHFLVQTEILGMDIPVAAAMLGSAMLAANDRLRGAALLSLLAFGFKVTGMVMTMAVITYILVMIWFDPRSHSESRPSYRSALLVALAVLGLEVGLEFLFDTSIPMLIGLHWFPIFRPPMALLTAPDVVALLVFVAAGVVGSLAFLVASLRRRSVASIGEWLIDRRMWLISWIVVAGFTAGVYVHVYVPRYVAPATALLIYLVGWYAARRPFIRPVGWIALAGAIVFNILNAEGKYYPPLDPASKEFIDRWSGLDVRSCAFTERSREYLPDLRANLDLCRKLETEFDDRPIVTAEPLYSFLTIPATGYVKKPLDVRRATTATQTIEMLSKLRSEYQADDPSTEPIVIWKRSARSLLPDRTEEDTVIFRDNLDPPVEAYQWRSFKELPADLRSLLVWYIFRTRRDDQLELSRLDLFMRTGRIEYARREIADWKKRMPTFGLIDELSKKVERTAAGEGEWDKVKYSWGNSKEK